MRRCWSMVGLGACAVLAGSSPPTNASIHKETGRVQVRCAAGVQVQLGDRPPQPADDDGVVFRHVPVGMHRITGHRMSHRSQIGWVDVRPEQVTVHQFGAWQPKPETLSSDSGALHLQTFPVEATITARKLGWTKIAKTDAPFFAYGVPTGQFKLTLCNAYKCIDHRLEIMARRVTSLFVDFDLGTVEDRSPKQKARLIQWTQACLRQNSFDACRQACMYESALGRGSRACHHMIRGPLPRSSRSEVVEASHRGPLP